MPLVQTSSNTLLTDTVGYVCAKWGYYRLNEGHISEVSVGPDPWVTAQCWEAEWPRCQKQGLSRVSVIQMRDLGYYQCL